MQAKALCVGIDAHKNYPQAALQGCVNDGHDMASVLMKFLGFTDSNISIPERSGLTRRELQIIEEILAGCSNLRIAKKLSISVNTVKRHLVNIFDKLAVSNRVELALLTMKPGGLGRAVRLRPSRTGTRRLPMEHRSN